MRLEADWAAIDRWVARQHPGLPTIEVEALAAWLADPGRRPPVLLDVRAAAEFAVSRLPGARLAPTLEGARAALDAVGHDAPIVAYCSVGVRSARLVEALVAAGWSQARNLRGSLFAWANRGLPLVDALGPSHLVHPYDATWGRLLDPQRTWRA